MNHIHPRQSAGKGLTPIGHLTAALANGYKPSAAEMRDLAYELQGAIVSCPEIEWLQVSFEAVGDAIHQAIKHQAWADTFCADRTDHSIFKAAA